MIFCYIWWIYQSFLVRDGSWFIYLDKLVLALKHNHPPWQNWPENMTCTQKSTSWHWFTPPQPHPRLSNTHTYMHTLPRASLVGRDWVGLPTTQQIGLSPHVPPTILPQVYKCWFCNFHAAFGYFVQNALPALKNSTYLGNPAPCCLLNFCKQKTGVKTIMGI